MGSTVTVALDPDLAGVSPIYRGRIQPLGQIGSLVRFPQGLVDLVGTVSLVGIAELAGPQQPSQTVQTGERWLQVQLLGQIERGAKRFERGVGTFPGLDDPVHFATAEHLAAVFPAAGHEHLRLGRLAAAEDVPVCLDVGRLVIRHSAVVGSTGAGKTSAVASLLQGFVRGGWTGANIVVVDPHGEYGSALGDHGAVRSVLGQGEGRLRVPFWAMKTDDLLRVLTGITGQGTGARRFRALVTEGRREFVTQAEWLTLDPAAVTVDTPVPFDLRAVWHQLDYENNEVRRVKKDPATVAVKTKGDPATLRPTRFEQYGPGGAEPFQSPEYGTYGALPERLRLALGDPRFQFLQEPAGDPKGNDPLIDTMQEWLGADKPVSVLDFAGVPDDAAETAIGVVMDLVFEAAVRTPKEGPGIGRPDPVLIVLEEAHRYLSESGSELTSAAANRIAREGRKYGVGLLMVTQRPSELPPTALSQCGTLIALRLSNSQDQGQIRSALPDAVEGLAAVLPSLRTGEAVISGEALVLPARALLDLPDPQPFADDPSLAPWRSGAKTPDLAPALARWRGTYEEESP